MKKNIAISLSLIILLVLFYILSNSINCRERYQNNSLVALQDFTKQAIRGPKGDLGLHMLEKNGRLSLGGFDSGSSGRDIDGEIQLYLAGKKGSGTNNGRPNHTTYKLKIDGYDNDGSIVYPIMCQDEDNQIDFSVVNRKSSGSKPITTNGGHLHFNGELVNNKLQGSNKDKDLMNHLVPKGTIIAFGLRTIPYGWAICNGSRAPNGELTPDLTNRFILGTNSSSQLKNKGGSNNITLQERHMPKHRHYMNEAGIHSHSGRTNNTGSHSHSGQTNDDGKHTHQLRTKQDDYNVSGGSGRPDNYGFGRDNGNFKYVWLKGSDSSTDGQHRHSFNTNSAGSHDHTFGTDQSPSHIHNITEAGSSNSYSHIPQNMKLYYIIKYI